MTVPNPAIMICPNCGHECSRDDADVGVGIIYGPWGCPCGWSESDEYNLLGSPREVPGYRVDQWGGLTPAPEGVSGDRP